LVLDSWGLGFTLTEILNGKTLINISEEEEYSENYKREIIKLLGAPTKDNGACILSKTSFLG
jgi:hypothetical protein